MTAETENPVPGLLRGMRADIAAIDERLHAIDERPEAVGTRLEGRRSVFVATTASLVAATKDHDTRILSLEGTPA